MAVTTRCAAYIAALAIIPLLLFLTLLAADVGWEQLFPQIIIEILFH
jgi:hypothetical protein